MPRTRLLPVAAVLLLLPLLPGAASAVVNGGFESGLASWTLIKAASTDYPTTGSASGSASWGAWARDVGSAYAKEGASGLRLFCRERPPTDVSQFCSVGVEQTLPAPRAISLWMKLLPVVPDDSSGAIGADLWVRVVDGGSGKRADYFFHHAYSQADPMSGGTGVGPSGYTVQEITTANGWFHRCLEVPGEFLDKLGVSMSGPMRVKIMQTVDDGAVEAYLDSVATCPIPWVTPPSPCGKSLFTTALAPISFSVRARSVSVYHTVTISWSALPTGMTYKNNLNPNGLEANVDLAWTPTASQVGTYSITFNAFDSRGRHADPCVVTIVVGQPPDPPAWANPRPRCDATVRAPPGGTVDIALAAASPGGRPVTIVPLTPLPPGSTFTWPPWPGTNPGTPANAGFTWHTDASSLGVWDIAFDAYDDLGQHAPPCRYRIIVDPWEFPYFVAPPCGTTISSKIGTPVTFHVEARSPVPRGVTLSMTGPGTLVRDSTSPSHPATGTYVLATPTMPAGVYTVTFHAVDTASLQAAPCKVTIRVPGPLP